MHLVDPVYPVKISKLPILPRRFDANGRFKFDSLRTDKESWTFPFLTVAQDVRPDMRWGMALILTSALMGVCGCAAPPPPAVAVPVAPPPPNLIDFLGFTALCEKLTPVVQHKIAHLATVFPFLKPKPCLKPLDAPENLKSPSPAISAAAAVIAAEGLAEQKIAGLKALAEVGCGGYPEVEEAFLASLSDPTEAVRFEAVQAIRYAAGDPCVPCGGGSCCTPEILKQLDKMTNGIKDDGCPFEPSPRVRRAARLALKTCGPPPLVPKPAGVPLEVPPAELLPPLEPAVPPPPPVPTAPVPEPPPVAPAPAPTGGVTAAMTNDLIKPSRPKNTIQQAAHQIPASQSDQGQVRWERVSIRIEDFASYDQSLQVMMALRQRTLGKSAELPAGVDPKISFETKVFGWTKPEDVPSTEIADALGRLSVGRISPMLEEAGQLHLVRILERR